MRGDAPVLHIELVDRIGFHQTGRFRFSLHLERRGREFSRDLGPAAGDFDGVVARPSRLEQKKRQGISMTNAGLPRGVGILCRTFALQRPAVERASAQGNPPNCIIKANGFNDNESKSAAQPGRGAEGVLWARCVRPPVVSWGCRGTGTIDGSRVCASTIFTVGAVKTCVATRKKFQVIV